MTIADATSHFTKQQATRRECQKRMSESTVDTVENDQPVGEWEKPLSPEKIRSLSVLRPWRSVLAICFEYVVIGLVIFSSYRLWDVSPFAGAVGYVAAVLLIGARQHALATLMHEGSHYRLFSNRFLNELVVQFFVAWVISIDVRNYRKHHFAHHRAPNTDDDPDWNLRESDDWSFPKTKRGLFFLFLGDLLGLRILDQYRFFGRYGMRKDRRKDLWDLARLLHMSIFIFAMTWLGLWFYYFVYWVVPMLTSLKAVLRMRTIAEHYALEYDHMFRQTRTTFPRFWERILFAPEYINFHLEHHLYPSVPFYNLPDLHRELMQSPTYRDNAHLTRGYLGVLRECLNCEHLTHQQVQQKQQKKA